MGNWTTVSISGTCNAKDVQALKAAINIGNDWDAFHCLCNTGGLCGLGDWGATEINVIGNLAERDYDTQDVVEQLKELVKIAPSLNLKIHIGGDNESLDCVATVNCLDGDVIINEAEIKTLPSIPEGQIKSNLMSALIT